MEVLTIRGVDLFRGYLDRDAQCDLVDALKPVLRTAPPVAMRTPFGRPMSVRMTSAGHYGWVSDRHGYRYARESLGGVAWPPIPAPVLDIWRALVSDAREPECCLVNLYGAGARMGMHQDRDEADFDWPVVSVSLGDEALFRIGNKIRGGDTQSIWLKSGDVVVMGGEARLTYHGVDRTRFGSSTLLADGGRVNLTLRVVT
jgi:DNA oxidative demethylase